MPDIDPIIIFIGGIINDDIMVAIRPCHSCIDIPIECIGANHMVITVYEIDSILYIIKNEEYLTKTHT